MVKATIEPMHEETLIFATLSKAREYVKENEGEDNYFELWLTIGNPEIYVGEWPAT
jgi:hypothetical protein